MANAGNSGEPNDVIANVDGIRAEQIAAADGLPSAARFTVPLDGVVDAAWQESFYTLQWHSLDAFYYQLEDDRRGISFACGESEGPERAPELLAALEDFLVAVNRAAAVRRGGGTPPEFAAGLLSLRLEAAAPRHSTGSTST